MEPSQFGAVFGTHMMVFGSDSMSTSHWNGFLYQRDGFRRGIIDCTGISSMGIYGSIGRGVNLHQHIIMQNNDNRIYD